MSYAAAVKIAGGVLAAISIVCIVLMIVYGFDGGLLAGAIIPVLAALGCIWLHGSAVALDNTSDVASVGYAFLTESQ